MRNPITLAYVKFRLRRWERDRARAEALLTQEIRQETRELPTDEILRRANADYDAMSPADRALARALRNGLRPAYDGGGPTDEGPPEASSRTE